MVCLHFVWLEGEALEGGAGDFLEEPCSQCGGGRRWGD